jgi:DnaJ-class molecular chaperone|tara:strand:+ start:1581 stop:1754 length:174 start_codon:yes stop_codon:yes gene_type:complete
MADSEKKTEIKSIKKICEVCKGNGFIRVPYEIAREEQWADCDFCDSQGEVDVDETRH